MTPQWIIDYAQDCRQLLGIGDEWRITITMTDRPDGDETNGGVAIIDAQYLNATIELNSNSFREETTEGHQLILHEMMHVSLANFRMVLDQIFMNLPEYMQTMSRIMTSQAEEQFIQRTSRAILAMLKPGLENS